MGDITVEEERAAKDNLDKMTGEAKKTIAAIAEDVSHTHDPLQRTCRLFSRGQETYRDLRD